MKQFFSALCLMVMGLSLQAQKSYSIVEDKNSTFYVPHSDFTDCAIHIRSTITDSLFMAYERIEENVPSGWGANLCDNAVCYGDLHSAANMAPFKAPAEAFMKITVNPMGIAGTAVVKYAVWDLNNPNQRDTLTFNIVVFWGASADQAAKALSGMIGPNPFSNTLQVSNAGLDAADYSIYDAMGRQVLNFRMEASEIRTLPLEALPRGIYILRRGAAAVRVIKD
jgi:hypothetical protein